MSYWRNPPYTAVKYFYTTVIALLFGTMFWGVGRKGNDNKQKKRKQRIVNVKFPTVLQRLPLVPICHKLTCSRLKLLYSCRDNQQDLLNAMGSMYASVIFMGVQNSGSVQPVVSVERTVFYRERAAHMYSPLPYALGQVKFIAIHYIQQSFQNQSEKKIMSQTEIAH